MEKYFALCLILLIVGVFSFGSEVNAADTQ